MNKQFIKEACVDKIEDIDRILETKDVQRFETCSNLEQGGLTPSLELFNYIKVKSNNIDQVIMIRVNDSFKINNDNEIDLMKEQIEEYIKHGGKHFIFGYITNENKIDMVNCNKLIEVIKKYSGTTWNFHMAIDEVDNYEEAFETLINNKFTRILTKGGKNQALDNLENLKMLNDKYGGKIEILVGGKVTKDNYLKIYQKTGIKQFHGTKIV